MRRVKSRGQSEYRVSLDDDEDLDGELEPAHAPAVNVRQLAMQLAPEIAALLRPAPRRSKPFVELVVAWLGTHLQRISVSDRAPVQSIAKRLAAGLVDETPETLTKSRAEAFLLSLTQQRKGRVLPIGDRLRNRYRIIGSQILASAIADGHWSGPNAFEQVQPWKLKKKKKPVLLPGEAARLVDAVQQKFRPLFASALYTCSRKAELIDWRREDIDLERGTYRVMSSHGRGVTKNGDTREDLPIHSELLLYLRRQLASHDSEWVFPDARGNRRRYDWNLSAVTRRALKRAGIMDGNQVRAITFHGLRRCGATLYKEAGTNDLVRKLVMGHAVRDITDKEYTTLGPDYVRAEVEKMRLRASLIIPPAGTNGPSGVGSRTNGGRRRGDTRSPDRIWTPEPKVTGSNPVSRISAGLGGTLSPLLNGYVSRLRSRFEEKVDRQGPRDCWPWLGAHVGGSGVFSVGAVRVDASQVAYELDVGVVPPGYTVTHACTGRGCCNPAHLRLVRKGRRATGETNGRAKLTAEAVRDILLRRSQGETQADLAREYGVSARAIRQLEQGVTWRDVTGGGHA